MANALDSPAEVKRQSAMPLSTPKKILCAVDLSPASAPVLGWAGLFAQHFDAKLEVLHAEWAEYPPYFLLSQEEELVTQVEERRVAAEKALDHIVRTSLASAIAPEITVIDLIVIVAQHHRFLEFTTLGTTTERVVRHADSAVLVLPGGTSRIGARQADFVSAH